MKLKTTLTFVIGLAISIAIFHLIGLEKLSYQISRVNLFFYGLAVGCFFLTIVLWTMRWKCFFGLEKIKISSFNLLKVLLIGLAVNNLTPIAKLGGEPVRIYILKKKNKVPAEVGVATILADLTVELITCLGFVIVSMIFIPLFINPPPWLTLIAVMFSFLAVVALLWIFGIYSNKGVYRIIRWCVKKSKRIRMFEERILEGYEKFQKSFRRNMKNKKVFVTTLIFGCMMKALDVIKYFLIFLALGYQPSFIQLVIALGIGIMLMSVPATPGNLGIFEGGMISAFVLMGIPPEVSASAVLFERIISFWFITFLGLLLGISQGINIFREFNLKDLRKYS